MVAPQQRREQGAPASRRCGRVPSGAVPPGALLSPREEPRIVRMKAAAWIVIAGALLFQSGCRSSDWIERTLVTVDVTGVWEGNIAYSTWSQEVVLVLQQQGARVTGR